MYYRMPCPRCSRRIEYTDVQVGHFAHCKKCNQEVRLRGNPLRVSMYLIWAAAVVFIAYGGMRLFRMTHREGRYSSEMIVPVVNHHSHNV